MKGGEKKGTDVRRVCGHLVSVGFSAACDVCGAKISLFDVSACCFFHWVILLLYISRVLIILSFSLLINPHAELSGS